MHFEEDIKLCLQVLNRGGIILYPTDTVWGLGCDATNEVAVSKIYDIKQRSDSKAMIVLVAELDGLQQYSFGTDVKLFDYLQTCQEPTTVIYEKGIGFAPNLLAADGSIAIRICKEEFCYQLIKQFGKPIVSTSANISGQLVAKNFQSIDPAVIYAADYVVKYRQNDETPYQPSSIIRWENGMIIKLR